MYKVNDSIPHSRKKLASFNLGNKYFETNTRVINKLKRLRNIKDKKINKNII